MEIKNVAHNPILIGQAIAVKEDQLLVTLIFCKEEQSHVNPNN